MNLITHEKAYALYPKATFEEHRSLMYSTEGLKQDTARKKYISRGWSMVERLTAEELMDRKSAFAPGHRRHVGDSKCWTIPLYPKLDLSKASVESNTWRLDFDSEMIPTMSFKILLTDCLRFSYLVVDAELAQYLWPTICPSDAPKRQVATVPNDFD
jgi:hypothetical protein